MTFAAKADKDVQSPDVLHTDKFILFVGALRTYKGIVLFEAAKSTRAPFFWLGAGTFYRHSRCNCGKQKSKM